LSGGRLWPKGLLVLSFALLGFGVMGYHPGVEDDGVYLAAVKADLQPDLYPHDAAFFKLQLQATVFDRCVAGFVELTRMPVAWAELFWQFLTIYLTLWAAHSIAARLFAEARAHWAGVALLAAMFTLPVAGTALCIVDQHLHPRGVATALILFAVSEVLTRRGWRAAGLLIGALAMHPIMAAFGVTFCVILAGVGSRRWRADAAGTSGSSRSIEGPAGAKAHSSFRALTARQKSCPDAFSCVSAVLVVAAPVGWMFDRPSESWREALESKSYFFLSRWAWYEWLGAIAPLVLFGLLAAWARRRGDLPLARFAMAVAVFGVFQQVVAMVMLGPPALVRLTPLQPMRFLHLVYVFMALVGGCLLGRYLLRARVWRWVVFLTIVNAGMFVGQRVEFAHSPHWELWRGNNSWVDAFEWVRVNTPRDAYFALDPYYLEAKGEDFHSFRALAERSQMADAVKDAAVVTQVPRLGPEWKRQVQALAGWKQFKRVDFERLKTEFGVNWVIAYPDLNPEPNGLRCPWHNDVVVICRIP
jgi:hypothetical protein